MMNAEEVVQVTEIPDEVQRWAAETILQGP